MKKLVAILITAAMVLALGIAVFADTPYSITIQNNPQDTNLSIAGKTFNAYKVFDVTYDEDGYYSYTLAPELEGFTYAAAGETPLIQFLENIQDNSTAINSFAKAAYNYIVANGIQPKGTATADSETVTISNLPAPGYYVIDGETEDASGETIIPAVALDTTDPTATVVVKAAGVPLDKNIVKDDTLVKGADYDVGDDVDFEIDTALGDLTGYTTYDFIIHDTLSAGLELDADSIVVTVGGTAIPASNNHADNTYTFAQNGQSFTISLNNVISSGYASKAPVVVTYSATILEGALTTVEEDNTAYVEFSNNPYDSSTHGDTPEEKVYVYDFDIDIDKYAAGDETEKLEGAVFALYKEVSGVKYYYNYNAADDCVEWVAAADVTEDDLKGESQNSPITVVTTDENGAAEFKGLEAGTYYLEETAAPEGYNKLDEAVEVEITVSYEEDGTIAETSATTTQTNMHQDAAIANSTGSKLPATGGIGVYIIYAVGAILVLGSAVLLIAKKKVSC